jgi:thiol-disulfide isomerase/thioredoxin
MNRTLVIRTILGSLSVLAVLVAGLLVFVKGEPGGAPGDYRQYFTGELMDFVVPEGGPAPEEVTFVDGNGETLSLADFKGKVILLNLWATWCGPCLNEMPTLDRLKAEMASDDFDVIAVSVDKAGVEKSRVFLERTGAEHLALYVDEAMALNFAWNAYSLPTTILIGRDGAEIGRMVGDKDWDSSEVKRLIRAVIADTKSDLEQP